jgi:hypothetical protein
MDTWVIVAIVAAAVLVVAGAIALWAFLRYRRTEDLRGTFGPEYDRVVNERGKGAGEKELMERRDRVHVFDVRALSQEQHEAFVGRWTETQSRFVDDPSAAITEADVLVAEVMKARGYPVAEDFDRRADDISVDHPDFVANYRSAHEISTRHESGQATTEELRRAMVNYRELFADLLGNGRGAITTSRAAVPAAERTS